MQTQSVAQVKMDPSPPLRLLEFRRSRVELPPLPFLYSPLIGRDREVSALTEVILAPASRLVTITGAGGIGKTRFALEVASHIARESRITTGFVPLAHLQEAEQMPGAISSHLKLATCSEESLLEFLGEHVHEPLLLVLDNLEQIRESGVYLIRLLAAAPLMNILVTSRSPLHVRGEIEFQLGPLTCVDDAGSTSPMNEPAAVSLFISRALDVNPGFHVSPDRRDQIAHICQLLDGLPLAIELAAARCRLMSPESMLPLLQSNLSFLSGGHRDSPERQQTVRNTIQWTYELLTPDVQKLFRLLSLFPAGFTFDAAELMFQSHVLTGPVPKSDLDVLEAIEVLSDFNLLRKSEGIDDTANGGRFTFYETVRVYGLERLTQAGEREPALTTLEEWCVDLASRAAHVNLNADHTLFDLLESEYPNIRVLFEWQASRKESRVALHILRDLAWFMTERYLLSEAMHWTGVFLDHEDARADSLLRAEGLDTASLIRYWTSHYEEARQLQEESLEIRRLIADDRATAKSLVNLANIVFDSGDLEWAGELLRESIALSSAAGDRQGYGHSASLLGRVALAQLDFDASKRLFTEAITIFNELGHRDWVALVHQHQGLYYLLRDQTAAALREYRDSMAISIATNDNWRIVSAFFGFAEIARRDRQFDLSIQLYAATERHARAMDIRLRKATEELIAGWFSELQQVVDAGTFARKWQEGLDLSRDEATQLALSLELSSSLPTRKSGTSPARSSAAAREAGLTPREFEILVLLSRGLGNREIAAELSISHRTVMQHLSNIFPKINVTTRTAAAVWAHRHDIV